MPCIDRDGEATTTASPVRMLKDLKGEEFSAYGVSREAGGVAIAAAPEASAAAKAGLKKGDLIQRVDRSSVSNGEQFFQALSGVSFRTMKLKVVRNQQSIELSLRPDSIVVVEAADSPRNFKKLRVPVASGKNVTASQRTNNESLNRLTDGMLARNYGPVFGNAVYNGAYKMDLGKSTPVSSITSWSHSQESRRGAQKLTIFASNSANDPGWDLGKFTPLGTIDSGPTRAEFLAASLRSAEGAALGTYRWIVWRVSPVSDLGGGENTAFQELSVESAGDVTTR